MSEKWKDRTSKETMQMFEGKHGLQDGRCMEITAEKLIRTLHTADTERYVNRRTIWKTRVSLCFSTWMES